MLQSMNKRFQELSSCEYMLLDCSVVEYMLLDCLVVEYMLLDCSVVVEANVSVKMPSYLLCGRSWIRLP